MLFRFVFLSAFFLMSFQQQKLVKKKINDRITVSIPSDWRPMEGIDFVQRYPSVRAPLAAFTNEERVADFSINTSATQWPDADLAIAKQFFKASLMNMFDRVEIIDEGIKEIKDKKFIFFEFQSRINGNNASEGLSDPVIKYTYQLYLVEKGQTLVFTFNAPRREIEQWQPVARHMMNLVRVK